MVGVGFRRSIGVYVWSWTVIAILSEQEKSEQVKDRM